MKLLKSCFIAILFLLVAARASAQAVQPRSSYQDTFQAVWQTINSNFFDPNFTGIDWQAVRERYRPQVEQVRDDAAFLALMQTMLRELPVSHLRIIVPGNRGAAAIGAQVRAIENQQIVTAVPLISDARRQGLRTGDVILTAWNEVVGAIGSTAALRVRGCDGRERAVSVRRETVSFSSERPGIQWQKIETQASRRIGYLRITQFEESSVPLIDAAMRDLADTSGIIIDVRDNAGGTNSFVRLISYLIPGQQFVSGLLTRSFLSRAGVAPERIDLTALPRSSGVYSISSLLLSMAMHGAIALYTEDMGDRVYRGRVIILTSGATGSAAEGFVAFMKQNNRAAIIGRATAGRLLTSNTFNLPNGWRLVVPVAVPITSEGRLFMDTPIPPHIEVRWTRQDVCDGRDSDITRALDALAQRQ